MISAISAIFIAIVYGLKTPLFAPAVFIARFVRKELSIFLFFLYCVLLGYELTVSEIAAMDEATVALLLSTIILLDESLSERRRNFADYSIFFLIPLSIFNSFLIPLLLILAMINILWTDRPRLGIAVILFGITAVYSAIALSQGMGSYRNALAEVTFLAAFCAFLFIFLNLLEYSKKA